MKKILFLIAKRKGKENVTSRRDVCNCTKQELTTFCKNWNIEVTSYRIEVYVCQDTQIPWKQTIVQYEIKSTWTRHIDAYIIWVTQADLLVELNYSELLKLRHGGYFEKILLQLSNE